MICKYKQRVRYLEPWLGESSIWSPTQRLALLLEKCQCTRTPRAHDDGGEEGDTSIGGSAPPPLRVRCRHSSEGTEGVLFIRVVFCSPDPSFSSYYTAANSIVQSPAFPHLLTRTIAWQSAGPTWQQIHGAACAPYPSNPLPSPVWGTCKPRSQSQGSCQPAMLLYLGGSQLCCFLSPRQGLMNSSRSLLSSPLFASSSPNFRSSTSIPSSSSPTRTSVPMIHDTSSRALTACHYSPSLVAEEQVHGSKDTLTLKGEKALLELLLDMALEQHIDRKELIGPETEDSDFESYLRVATSQVLDHTAFIEENNATSPGSSTSAAELGAAFDLGTPSTMLPKEVVLPAEESGSSATQKDVRNLHRMNPNDSYEELLSTGQVFIRSNRLLERRSRKRNAPRASSNDVLCSVVNSKKKEKSKKFGRVLDPDEPLKLFLRDRETTEFLTAKEEKHLFSQIQNLMKLEEAQRKLQAQCGRDPTIAEWAQAVGMSCRELQSTIRTGRRCREKMARSNFRLVIHVARKYEGYGLDIQDLVQDGCCGLMKTFEKFNPSKGCRFPTYAYWWIRQSIKKSIFKNSRLIRLPESVYALMRKVGKARTECIMEGEQPTNENIARRAGITTEKLARLRAKTKKTRSMQDRVWSDDGVTLQEITEDPNVEPPELSIERLMMRQQVRDFLGILSPREKEIIEHRFGIHDGEPKTLHVIGDIYGLSKERIRQVQNKALDKLKKSVAAQGFDAYFDLLT